jgi:TrmH family RNA methyltransferase
MTEAIISPANPRIKALVALRRKGAASGDPRILIDGLREIERALRAGLAISELYVCPGSMDRPAAADLLGACRAAGVEMVEVSEPVFEKIRYGDRTGGLVAVAPRPRRRLEELALSPAPLVAVVENIGKPGNLGGILRSADGAGVEAVVVIDPAIDIYGPNVIRASVSTVFSVPVVPAARDEAVAWLRGLGAQVVAASPDGSRDYATVDYRGPTALVFGSEDRGLSGGWRGGAVIAARVPMLGISDSLNVAATAAILFYEARRQRQGSGQAG